MKTRIERNSGASGMVSALLAGRSDLIKQMTGDELVSNFIVLPEGPRTRRPGTRFMGALKDETRPVQFIEFDAGPGDTYMLVVNGGVIRFYKDALLTTGTPVPTPYELAHDWTDDQIGNLFPAQSQDVIFIASGGKPKRLTRYADTHWVLDDYPYVQGPLRLQNTDKAVKLTPSAATGSINILANAGVFQAGHIGSVWRLDEADYSDPPNWKALETPLIVGNRRRYKSKIYSVSALNGTGDAGPNPPTHDDGDYFSSAGNVTWRFESESFAYVRITGHLSPTQVTAQVISTIPASIVANGTFRWWEAGWSDVRGWPTVVSISDQSLVWAKGNTGNMSSPTDIYDFSITAEADSAVEFPLVSPDGKRTDIQWIMPAGIIIAGSASSEWIVRGTANIYDRLTDTTQKAIRQGSKGSARHVPALIDEGAVAISRARRSLFFIKFDAVTEQVQIKELTTYSRSVLKGKAQQIVAQSDPYSQLFLRDANGKLLSLAFVPDEDVTGWAEHPMRNGKVIQIGAKQASDESHTELWLCVERVINGVTRRYVERMEPYFDAVDDKNPDATGAWFIDCGQTYSGPATATITGADHLEGQEVAVFCNGQEFARRTVSGGQFTIERPMTNVSYGIPLTGEIVSMPFETQVQFGTTRGSSKTTARIHLDTYQSLLGEIGIKGGKLSAIPRPADLALGSPMPLQTGIQTETVEPTTTKEVKARLVCDNAMPFTLRSWIVDPDIKDAP